MKRLELLCAEVYQVAGAAGAPMRVLDALSAAANGRPIRRTPLLPIAEREFELFRTAVVETHPFGAGFADPREDVYTEKDGDPVERE